MPFVQAKCPNCGGILAVDNKDDAAVCPFCNKPYIVEKAIKNYNGDDTKTVGDNETAKKDCSNDLAYSFVCNEKDFSIGTSTGDLMGYSGNDENVRLPESVTRIISLSMVFRHCTNMKRLYIPKSVTDIGSIHINDFLPNLEVIIVDPDNPMYDSRENCNAIIDTVTNTLLFACKGTTIPDGITTIGDNAFGTNSENISIPKSVINISKFAFLYSIERCCITVDPDNPKYDSREDCNAIIETEKNSLILGCTNTTIPDGIKSIGDRAFSHQKMTSIVIPDSVESIGGASFVKCNNLKQIIIPNGISKIEYNTFLGCLNLSEITIPDSVTYIHENAFYDCNSLTVIHANEENTEKVLKSIKSELPKPKEHIAPKTKVTFKTEKSEEDLAAETSQAKKKLIIGVFFSIFGVAFIPFAIHLSSGLLIFLSIIVLIGGIGNTIIGLTGYAKDKKGLKIGVSILLAIILILGIVFAIGSFGGGGYSNSSGKCPVCNGAGQVLTVEGGHAVREPCKSCNGTGRAG